MPDRRKYGLIWADDQGAVVARVTSNPFVAHGGTLIISEAVSL